MATLREYFDADFSYAARVHIRPALLPEIEAVLLYDFAANTAFLACYVEGQGCPVDFFFRLIEALQPGKSQVNLAGRVTLPATRAFPGQLQVNNTHPFEMRAQFHGETDWISTTEIGVSNRLFIYSETSLVEGDINLLKERAKELGLKIQFRSAVHAEKRSAVETPLAFISHDSRDKDLVARKIANELQRMLCPVWYDEFSLSVGDNLRDSIESGLKNCRKCVLILSQNFFSNRGWTKKEFDSIFTREVLEKKQLVLPVWFGVTEQDVYNYSPSLLNVKGLDWNALGSAEVARQLCRAILDRSD